MKKSTPLTENAPSRIIQDMWHCGGVFSPSSATELSMGEPVALPSCKEIGREYVPIHV